jgi:DASS family divalent anion:Na+ symporter
MMRTSAFSPNKFFAIISILIGCAIWFLSPPTGVDIRAWHLLAVFVFTIMGLISKFAVTGVVVFISMATLTMTKTLSFPEAFLGFSNEAVWLIVFAFFIARGFIKTGLGLRISYKLMALLGKSTLGLGYGMAFADLILAPAIPSVTARAGGITYPIVAALSRTFESFPNVSPYRIGAYLIQTTFQCSSITSAMFLTAMAGNPMIQHFAKNAGVDITWSSWALAAIVPGLVSLIVIPFVMYKLYPPEIKNTPQAKEFAHDQLKKIGSISKKEWIMVLTFILLISLWVMAPVIKISATITALFGLSLLLVTNVLNWEDILNERGAWDTLIWFGALVTMASSLNQLGLMDWFSNNVVEHVTGFHWISGFTIIGLIYFYSHYFFASNTAHITAMYPPFLLVSIGIGTPPMLAALVLGFFSSLFGSLTTYGSGPAPIYFGSGYVKIGEWWKFGFIMSIINIFIWIIVGGAWWYLIGLFNALPK